MGIGIGGIYITTEEWKVQYKAKHNLLLERGFEEVAPMVFYRDLFPEGSLQKKGERHCGKGNMIVTQVREKEDTEKSRQWVATDDLKMVEKSIGDKFGLIGPLSYFGKKNLKGNAHELFAITVDLDYVHEQQLKNLLKQFDRGIQLTPTYLVNSGRGLHLYYFLKEPVPLYRNLEKMLSSLKQALTDRLWNDTSSLKGNKQDIDKAGIYQNFRSVGSQSKIGEDFPVRAYKVCDRRYSLEDIRDSIPYCKIQVEQVHQAPEFQVREKGVPLEKAKELWPDWYEERIVKGIPSGKKWLVKRDLYEWWKRMIVSDVRAGGRYYSIYALACYGRKCNIPTSEIRKDAWDLYDLLESRTDDELNHFKKSDVIAALKQLYEPKAYRCTREFIADNCKVIIPEGNRNHRKRKEHLHADQWKNEKGRPTINVCKQNRELALQYMRENGEIKGRPVGSGTAQAKVQQYRSEHPNAKPKDCIEATGLSKNTVYKWWNSENTISEE